MTDAIERASRAKAAKRILATASTEQKNKALAEIGKALYERREEIFRANETDLEIGRKNGLSDGLLDRLMLNDARVKGLCDCVAEVAALDDPVGITLSETVRPNGLSLKKVTVPIGVIAVIFEARPNVSADSAALCLKSGNAVVLRGGKEAINSNLAIVSIMRDAVEKAGLPADCINLIHDTTRESAAELMRATEYIDLLIPRGGRGLIDSVVQNAVVPVIQTGAGVCHTYVDKSADTDMAAAIIYNAKVSRPSVCNSLECILVHKDIADAALPKIKAELDKASVEIRGDENARMILHGIAAATQEDWGKEYNDLILAVKVVGDEEKAIEHIERYGTHHSDAIITDDSSAAEYFLNSVDSAAVYVNASTRFTDGGEFGLGAEIGISTQKLHARGPLGLRELVSFKYKIHGSGQIR